MTPTQLCTSLERSKRLKELNVPQKSYFYWSEQDTLFHPMWDDNPNIKTGVSAFTASELGEMLPDQIRGIWGERNKVCKLSIRKVDTRLGMKWEVVYDDWLDSGNEVFILKSVIDKIEADARAKMLIHLIEQELIDHKSLGKGEQE